MDRDRNANVIDPEERATPSTGESDTGEIGEERRRQAEQQGEDVDRGSQPAQHPGVPVNPD